MTSIIESIFGKINGISEEDLNQAIVKEILLENFEIECKEIHGKNKEHKEKIIAPIVSFLNSGRGNGLICLGLSTRDGVNITDKPGVKKSYIKNEESLRAIIFQNIGTIPKYMKPFDLKIIIVPVDNDKNVFLVEIYSQDPYCLYYSKITNHSYERRGDEDKILSLPETFDLVSKRNYAKVFVCIDEQEENNDTFNMRFSWENIGTEPGKSVSTSLIIYSPVNVVYNFLPTMPSAFHLDHKENKLIFEIQYIKTQFTLLTGFPPSTKLAYPGQKSIFGNISINKTNDFTICIDAITYEEKGKTIQKFIFKFIDKTFSLENSIKEFEPYLKI